MHKNTLTRESSLWPLTQILYKISSKSSKSWPNLTILFRPSCILLTQEDRNETESGKRFFSLNCNFYIEWSLCFPNKICVHSNLFISSFRPFWPVASSDQNPMIWPVNNPLHSHIQAIHINGKYCVYEWHWFIVWAYCCRFVI